MGLADLTREFGGGPLALVAGGLFISVGAVFWLLIASYKGRILRAETRADVLEGAREADRVRHEAVVADLNKENRAQVVSLNMATQLLLAYLDKRGQRKEKETAHERPK